MSHKLLKPVVCENRLLQLVKSGLNCSSDADV